MSIIREFSSAILEILTHTKLNKYSLIHEFEISSSDCSCLTKRLVKILFILPQEKHVSSKNATTSQLLMWPTKQ